MTTMSEGYLVVLRWQLPTETLYNPQYKGVYRIPPFSMEKYENGFDDPYLFGKYTDDDGLIPELSLAKEMLQDYTEIEPSQNLEIIYARNQQTFSSKPISKDLLFLGFDIATTMPFWSIVNDSPAPSDPRFHDYLKLLNESGLFDSEKVVGDYLASYLLHYPSKGKHLRIWEVYVYLGNSQ